MRGISHCAVWPELNHFGLAGDITCGQSQKCSSGMSSSAWRQIYGLQALQRCGLACGMLMAAWRGPASRSPRWGRFWLHSARLKPLLAREAASSACCTSASAARRCTDPATDTYLSSHARHRCLKSRCRIEALGEMPRPAAGCTRASAVDCCRDAVGRVRAPAISWGCAAQGLSVQGGSHSALGTGRTHAEY